MGKKTFLDYLDVTEEPKAIIVEDVNAVVYNDRAIPGVSVMTIPVVDVPDKERNITLSMKEYTDMLSKASYLTVENNALKEQLSALEEDNKDILRKWKDSTEMTTVKYSSKPKVVVEDAPVQQQQESVARTAKSFRKIIKDSDVNKDDLLSTALKRLKREMGG